MKIVAKRQNVAVITLQSLFLFFVILQYAMCQLLKRTLNYVYLKRKKYCDLNILVNARKNVVFYYYILLLLKNYYILIFLMYLI